VHRLIYLYEYGMENASLVSCHLDFTSSCSLSLLCTSICICSASLICRSLDKKGTEN